MHLKKFKFSSGLRRPETQFMYAQGHQREGALTSSTNITQNTFLKVYKVEFQKTINPKLQKQSNLFSESNQRDISSQLSGELD